jgi:hypothetical protein
LSAVFTRPDALQFELGQNHFRRSELDWIAHGSPRAIVRIAADPGSLLIGVSVRTKDPNFAPSTAEPYLDNEHPDVNSDGVQLHLMVPDSFEGSAAAAALLLVPELEGVRVRQSGERWRTALKERGWAADDEGYSIALRLDRATLPRAGTEVFFADVVVNLLAAKRERRSGQLMLSGLRAPEEWIYLVGDRQDPGRLLPFRIIDE